VVVALSRVVLSQQLDEEEMVIFAGIPALLPAAFALE
jgi:hypothetical protein